MSSKLNPSTDGAGKKIAIVVSQFNGFITEKLLAGAEKTLTESGVKDADILTTFVPGAFELPLACLALASSGHYQAVIALGCVIKGATPHFDYVCAEAARGINQAGLETGVPVIFGVLTTDTVDQALERSGDKANKGTDSALAALHMANLMGQLQEVAV